MAPLVALLETPRFLARRTDLLALYKPAGMHVFGPVSLCAWLLEQQPALAGVGPADSPAIAHRLDRDTSGLILACQTLEAYRTLRRFLSGGRVAKVYLALASGCLQGEAEVDAPLGGRHRRSSSVQVARPGKRLRGVRPAQSRILPLSTMQSASLCRVEMRTGMRHQIRAHLAHLGHPLLGDRQYGASSPPPDELPGFLLHAWALELEWPAGARLRLICPPPERFVRALAALGLPGPPNDPFESCGPSKPPSKPVDA